MVLWAGVLLAAVMLCGCGKKQDFLKTHPAKGTATFRGKPMRYAHVTLHPVGGDEKLQKVRPRADVGEDGSFVLGTYRFDDGAPPGQYKVTLIWPNGPQEQSESPGYVRDQLQGRYEDVNKSTIQQVTISEGENTLPPIELK